jgi:flagellar biosynthesis protein FliQ
MKLVQKRNKKGAFSDLFLLMIFAIIIVFISVLFVYMGGKTVDKLHETMDNMSIGDTQGNNASVVIDNSMGAVTTSYQSLTWITVFLIIGMIISIFIGSYLVTTKPIFFVPYLFIVIIAVIVAVPLSNAYETIMNDATLSGTFAEFSGANWLMLNLPIWITIVGITGGIIMFSRMGKKEDPYGQY